jgi:uncharacterized protein (TIGR03083 family)
VVQGSALGPSSRTALGAGVRTCHGSLLAEFGLRLCSAGVNHYQETVGSRRVRDRDGFWTGLGRPTTESQAVGRRGRTFSRDSPLDLAVDPQTLKRSASEDTIPNSEPGRASDNMASGRDDHLWALVYAERAALAEDLSGLSGDQWRHSTLCGRWDVEDVVAHLTAAATLNQWQWMRSMLGARFRVEVHNQRRMLEHRGATPAETLDRFRAVIGSTTAPSGHTPAYLGEVVVHAQDIRLPLGLPRTPTIDALTPVAEFFASRNFAVPSRTAVAGLELRADDGSFAAGTGALVTGTTLALTMSMAGRAPYVDQLDGPGVPSLRERVQSASA